MASAKEERTLLLIKPIGVQRGLVGKIIKRFEEKGFKLVGLKFMWASEGLLKQHYSDLADRPFFPSFIKYMSSGPVVPMVWEGLNAVKTGRVMLCAPDPSDSAPGSIRGDLCIQFDRNMGAVRIASALFPHDNVIHGSDSLESAEKEIALWFDPKELVQYSPNNEVWVFEK